MPTKNTTFDEKNEEHNCLVINLATKWSDTKFET